jgi:penicillin-binding protein 2
MSRFDKEQTRLFTRRALLVAGGQLALFGVLGARMFQLQVLDRNKYLMQAENNRVNMSLLAPERGMIYDRFDVPLAVNVQDFRLLLVEEQNPDIPKTLDVIDRVVPLSPERRVRIMRDLNRQRQFLPVLIADNLTWEQMSAIEVAMLQLPGVTIDEGTERSYPLKQATAHVLGYVGIANEKEVKEDTDPLLELPGFQMGKQGLEKQYDRALRGLTGRMQEEVNASGRKVRTLNRNEGAPGAPLHLTLDAELQLFTQGRLASERSASAVVMDAYSGAVYALASHPAYDPNVFNRGIPTALWNELLEDISMPLTNKAIAGQYPPGSTFKMMTAMAGLDAKVTSDARRVFCGGHIELGDHRFHCWKPGGHGHVNLHEALAQSCDVYFYQVAMDVGIDKIAAMARRFGLGSASGIDMPGERPGLIPDQKWKRDRLKQPWNKGETLVNAIGQGFTLATPLQLAVMTARLINGGLPVKPYLAESLGTKNLAPTPLGDMQLNLSHLAMVKDGMDAVINGPTGTARAAKAKDPAFAFGGKTGTSQVRRITMAERARGMKMEELGWASQHHALFVGYAPLESPRFVCAVVIEHGASGAGAAAPIARDLLVETQKRNPDKKRI